jgi:hypothetical protein
MLRKLLAVDQTETNDLGQLAIGGDWREVGLKVRQHILVSGAPGSTLGAFHLFCVLANLDGKVNQRQYYASSSREFSDGSNRVPVHFSVSLLLDF